MLQNLHLDEIVTDVPRPMWNGPNCDRDFEPGLRVRIIGLERTVDTLFSLFFLADVLINSLCSMKTKKEQNGVSFLEITASHYPLIHIYTSANCKFHLKQSTNLHPKNRIRQQKCHPRKKYALVQ